MAEVCFSLCAATLRAPANSLLQLSCAADCSGHGSPFPLAKQEADECIESGENKNLAIGFYTGTSVISFVPVKLKCLLLDTEVKI